MQNELWKMRVPVSALIKGPVFTALPKRECEISFHIEGQNGEPKKISLLFNRVEAYRCTYLTSCSAEMFKSAYGKLVSLGINPWLSELLTSYRKAVQQPNDLQHLMICFDGPCYEIICVGHTVTGE